MQQRRILVRESAAAPEAPARTIIREATGSLAVENGRIRIRLIDEGQGSSGYFPAAVLEQAANDRIFRAGTRMHLDHPGRTTGDDLPERSVKDWVAVLAEDAVWDAATHALEADATVFASWRQIVEDVAPYVGVSIRAYATAAPDGTITRLTEALSVDFVTEAGRGGRVLRVLESARPALTEATSDDRRQQLRRALSDAYSDPEHQHYIWLRDYDETQGMCWFEQDDHTWQQTWQVGDDDLTITLTGNPIEVQPVTRYLPLDSGESLTTQSGAKPGEGPTMPTITEAELSAYQEAQGRVTTLTAESQTLTAERDTAVQERDAARAQLAEARAATAEAQISAADLPDAAKKRLREAFQAKPDVDVPALITQEADYIKQIAPAKITGFGSTTAAESGAGRPTRTPWGREIKEA